MGMKASSSVTNTLSVEKEIFAEGLSKSVMLPEALALIFKLAGAKFDPVVVEALDVVIRAGKIRLAVTVLQT